MFVQPRFKISAALDLLSARGEKEKNFDFAVGSFPYSHA
jgi:hypothetical protein